MRIRFSTKCKYALRTILELSLMEGSGIVKSQQIASAQRIPLRFLEIILAELRQGGFVESKRGNAGGYVLARPAEKITVTQVIDFIEGHKNTKSSDPEKTAMKKDDPFAEIWQELDLTCMEVLNRADFADLAAKETKRRNLQAPNYVI